MNQSGTFCPLTRQKVCDSCHDCEFWQPLYQAVDGREQRVYNCAFVWGMFLQGVNNTRIDALQKATESMRNEFAGFKVSVHQLARVMADAADKRAQRAQPPPMKDITNGER